MDRPNEHLLSRLEQSLRQSRAARMHLAARLRELEAEADSVRAELAEMDLLASQTEAAIYRLVSTVLASNNLSFGLPSDAELEAAMDQSQRPANPRSSVYVQPPPAYAPAQSATRTQSSVHPQSAARTQAPVAHTQNPIAYTSNPIGHTQNPIARTHNPIDRRAQIPTVRDNVEVLSDRFMDRTIPQAVTLLLREEGGPLHVNEIYNRLLEGGFRFTGQNPTISVAVSLNRNTRFRKVAPGTFDLVMRDASSKAS